jgi:NTE family protein
MDMRPDILILGAGGIVGRAWLHGVLAGIEDSRGFEFRDCDYLIGTSAGAVVATELAGGQTLRRPVGRGDAEELDATGRWARPGVGDALARAAAPFGHLLSPAFTLTRPAGARARAAVFRAVPRGDREHTELRTAAQNLQVSFDGRLRLAGIEVKSGQRVMFGSPGAPRASVEDALAAACAVPPIYAPVRIGDAEYVDGGFWSPANADTAPARRGARVLCLLPIGSRHGPLSAVMRVPCRAITETELTVLRSRGSEVRLITPDRESARAMGCDLMARDATDAVLAASYAQGLALSRA